MKLWRALRLAAALVVLAGASATGWLTALRTTFCERVDDLAQRGLVRSVAERRAPREPAALAVHARLDELLTALAGRPGYEDAAKQLRAPFPSVLAAASDAALRALVAAGGQDLAALDSYLAEPATAEVARAPLPSSAYKPNRHVSMERAAVLGLAAGAVLSLDGTHAPSPRAERQCAMALGRAFDLARLLDDGCMLSAAKTCVLESDLLALVLRSLDAGASPRALASELEHRLSAVSAPGRAERALRYEADSFVGQWREASIRADVGTALGSWNGPFSNGELNTSLDEYEHGIEVARLAPEALLAHAGEGGLGLGDTPDSGGFYLAFVDDTELGRARLALARAALELEAVRADTGSWPADLAGLPGAIDPHTGEPFPYRVEGGRAVLGPPAWARERFTDEEQRVLLLLWVRGA